MPQGMLECDVGAIVPVNILEMNLDSPMMGKTLDWWDFSWIPGYNIPSVYCLAI